MPIIAAIMGGGIAYAGSKKAGEAATKASQAAVDEERRQFDLQWEASQPSRDALARMGRILSGEEEIDITSLPGYQDRLQQGLDVVTTAQNARGGRFGGRALKELSRYGQNFAASERGNYLNRLAGLAGLRGDPSAPGISNAIMAGGAGQANAIMSGAQGINAAIQGGFANYNAQQAQQRIMNLLGGSSGAGASGAGIGAGL